MRGHTRSIRLRVGVARIIVRDVVANGIQHEPAAGALLRRGVVNVLLDRTPHVALHSDGVAGTLFHHSVGMIVGDGVASVHLRDRVVRIATRRSVNDVLRNTPVAHTGPVEDGAVALRSQSVATLLRVQWLRGTSRSGSTSLPSRGFTFALSQSGMRGIYVPHRQPCAASDRHGPEGREPAKTIDD